MVSRLPISRIAGRNRRKSPAPPRNIPVFGRRRPETGFDLHCLTEYAVQLAKFCVAHYARKSLNSIPSRNIWQYMRDNWLSNRVFKSYDDSRGVDIRRLA
jgi:hypothetical protein